MSNAKPTRLVSFLGTGSYQETTYVAQDAGGASVRTIFAARAVAAIHRASEIVILATTDAQHKHGDALRGELRDAGLAAPHFVTIPLGRDRRELWQQFELLRACLAESPGPVVLDITHGLRSTPFFGGAAVSFVRNASETSPEIKVVYGAFDLRDKERNETPLWDLSLFVELDAWTYSIATWLGTGDATVVAAETRRLGDALAKSWAQGGQRGPRPRVGQFAKALEQFSDALVTVRTGGLLLGRNGLSLARKLLDATNSVERELASVIPPVAAVLSRVRRRLEPLCTTAEHLGRGEGLRSLAALARLSLQHGRYADAAALIREAWVSSYAERAACVPGHPSYDVKARDRAEAVFYSELGDLAREIAEVRNDVEHAGFRRNPMTASTIRDKLMGLLDELDEHARSPAPPPATATPRAARRILVTRHPALVEWCQKHGVAFDEHRAHLDAAEVGCGDTVIGALPMHLAAEICKRGGTYEHIALELHEDQRGRELDLREIESCNPHVRSFSVRQL